MKKYFFQKPSGNSNYTRLHGIDSLIYSIDENDKTECLEVSADGSYSFVDREPGTLSRSKQFDSFEEALVMKSLAIKKFLEEVYLKLDQRKIEVGKKADKKIKFDYETIIKENPEYLI